MLKLLRENASSIIIQLIFVVIVLVFVFFGISPPNQTIRTVATVNGERITDNQFQNLLRQRLQFFPNLTPERELQIRESVLNQLIDDKLLAAEAQEQGYVVSDHELRKTIRARTDFQNEEGEFVEKLYLDWLDRNNYPRYRFEQDQRDALQLSRVVTLLNRSTAVTPADIERAFRTENDKLNLEFVRVPSLRYEGQVDTSDAAVDAYLAANAQKVRDYFNERADTDYTHERQAKASHILLNTEDADEAEKAELRKRMEGILAEARGGADFGDLARKYSEDPGSTLRGGDLGFFTYERMVPEFSEAAFNTEPGAISDIVTTSYGFHIIKTMEIKEARIDTFEDVKRDIAKLLMKEAEAPGLALAAAEELRSAWESNAADLDTQLQGKGLRKQETGEFGADVTRIPRLGDVPEALSWALTQTTEGATPGRVITADGDAYLLRLKSRSSGDEELTDEKRDEIRRRLLTQQRTELSGAYRETLRETGRVKRKI